jgi:hypothetical protein
MGNSIEKETSGIAINKPSNQLPNPLLIQTNQLSIQQQQLLQQQLQQQQQQLLQQQQQQQLLQQQKLQQKLQEEQQSQQQKKIQQQQTQIQVQQTQIQHVSKQPISIENRETALQKIKHQEINGQYMHDFIGNIFFKFINDKFTHYGYKYVKGRNKDTQLFKPSGSCIGGGLYFADKTNINDYSNFGENLAVIRLYSDSRVYVEDKKFKTDKFYIEEFIKPDEINKVDISNPSLEDIKIYPPNLKNCKNPTYEMCFEAVSRNGMTIQYVPKNYLNREIIIKAVSQNGMALQYIDDKLKTQEICEIAIKQNGAALQFANNNYL